MKIKESEIVDKSIGIEEEMSFKIDQESGIIYDILRSKMYRDPISSIVREIASNARDANREASKEKESIKVYFENDGDNGCDLFTFDSVTINFKDSGFGMNPEKVKEIYLVYGNSDKRQTDALTGGWGLGAKTPRWGSYTVMCN